MKKITTLAAFILSVLTAMGQTMNIHIGQVTYCIPAEQAGEMVFQNGQTLTIGLKTYALSEISSIGIDNSSVADNTVAVAYSGNTAEVMISGNLAPYLTAKVNGGHVSVVASSNLAQEVTYTLSGTSDNGSFYMDGDHAITLVLNGLNLTNPDSAAINIQDGKKINVQLADGTANTLADGLTNVANDDSDGHKAAFYVEGHTSWSGSGHMTLKGNVKHAYSSDEYTLLNAGLGSITVSSAVSDGFHISQYFNMKGGTVSIVAAGDGIDVGKKKTDKENNGMMILEGGTLNVTTSGQSTKALKCESDLVVIGGDITATTSGDAVYEESEADLSSCAAAKCDGEMTMSGGTMTLTSTGAGGKGINATGAITINGGTLTVVTTGSVLEYGTLDSKPQAIKSDANIILAGGTILSCASADKGSAFKTDFQVLTNGATVMGIGGKAITPATSSTHGYKKYTGIAVTGGQTLSYDGVTFTIPSNYSNSSAKVLVSSASM